jgi:aminoglycoside/choline kinase family phosphotransferase
MEINQIKKLFENTPELCSMRVVGSILLKGDASTRRYTRVLTGDGSVILMELDDSPGPVSDGGITILQRETFPQVQSFLKTQGISVPKILANIDDRKILVVEDIGDVSLGRLVREPQAPDCILIKSKLGMDPIKRAYELAISEMLKIQNIKSTNHFIFQKELGRGALLVETKRFIEMYAQPQGATTSQIQGFEQDIENLVDSICKYPKVLSHRDFMPMNIHFKPDGSVVLIDFQDMCLAPQGYDLGSLLTDRDFDLEIGNDLISQLIGFASMHSSGLNIEEMYSHCVLQRSLRLIGQFTRLGQTRSTFYQQFVPGCIARAKKMMNELKVCPAIAAYLE